MVLWNLLQDCLFIDLEVKKKTWFYALCVLCVETMSNISLIWFFTFVLLCNCENGWREFFQDLQFSSSDLIVQFMKSSYNPLHKVIKVVVITAIIYTIWRMGNHCRFQVSIAFTFVVFQIKELVNTTGNKYKKHMSYNFFDFFWAKFFQYLISRVVSFKDIIWQVLYANWVKVNANGTIGVVLL